MIKYFMAKRWSFQDPNNENIVMMSEREYNEIMKAKNNAEYLAMVDRSVAEAEAGDFIRKSI